MTTRADLRAILREVLSNTTQWPDATLNVWIASAIRDYSTVLPRTLTATITCTTAVTYALTSYTGIQTITRVEYPTAEDPPRYLARRPETGIAFEDTPCYDVRGAPPATLVIGEEPTAGEFIGLTYLADHLIPTDDVAALTVPDHHLETLGLFVHWQAIRELEMAEAVEPNTTSVLLSMYGLNAGRAERLYRAKLADNLKAQASSGYAGPWRMDIYDPIY